MRVLQKHNKGDAMFKVLAQEIKDFDTWKEAAAWLKVHGWGEGLIVEQELLWKQFKATGEEKANIFFDIVEQVIAIEKKIVEEVTEAVQDVKEIIADVQEIVTEVVAVAETVKKVIAPTKAGK